MIPAVVTIPKPLCCINSAHIARLEVRVEIYPRAATEVKRALREKPVQYFKRCPASIKVIVVAGG